MKRVNRILLTLGIGLVLVVGFFIVTNAITKYTGFLVSADTKEDDFEICLKEQDITIYINTNNPSSTIKNIQLIDYLDYFEIKNCFRNNEECIGMGVDSFPTWIINKNKINEDVSFK